MAAPPLPALRTFEVAARHLSFTKAAAELHVTQGAVSQQIKQLEASLGFALFHRGARGLTLTEKGEALAETAQRAFRRLFDKIEELRQPEEGGILTVSVSPSLAVKWLIPRLGRFYERHPEVDLRIRPDPMVIDLLAESDSVDMAIRFGQGPFAELAAVPFMHETVFAVASPLLLSKGPPLKRPSDLRHHTLLHSESVRLEVNSMANWEVWLALLNVDGVDAKLGPTFPSSYMLLQAAMHGQGVALTWAALADDDLRAGRLVRLFDRAIEGSMSYFALTTPAAARKPKVIAFRDWLVEEGRSFTHGATPLPQDVPLK
ncbi:transcriptional regulator GcvA [Pelagibius marinus]|uniref:transcriptional regulator GcvA n=1 Tax=Pelagibius marinus TaxID=2762760 RepID=UPI0018731542|nr:transcriptional regulator GcvA [Pelagibius marinus]